MRRAPRDTRPTSAGRHQPGAVSAPARLAQRPRQTAAAAVRRVRHRPWCLRLTPLRWRRQRHRTAATPLCRAGWMVSPPATSSRIVAMRPRMCATWCPRPSAISPSSAASSAIPALASPAWCSAPQLLTRTLTSVAQPTASYWQAPAGRSRVTPKCRNLGLVSTCGFVLCVVCSVVQRCAKDAKARAR